MSKALELYKAFIDGLVERKDSITALCVNGDGFPKTANNKAKNDLLAVLTPEQKSVLVEILQDEHIAGIYTTLAYINKMMDLDGLELHQDGELYPNDYFESLHYDFISRCDGNAWPEITGDMIKAIQIKTLTIQLNNDQLPILPVEPETLLSFTIHADGNELELTGNRVGLLLLAKAALGMAETSRRDGFQFHLDDLYSINTEGKSILIQKEERSKL